MRFYKVVAYRVDGDIASLADSRRVWDCPRSGMLMENIWAAPTRSYVVEHYASGGPEVLLTLEAEPDQIAIGSLEDREPELALNEARVVAWELLPREKWA